jgi:hypothetical protein
MRINKKDDPQMAETNQKLSHARSFIFGYILWVKGRTGTSGRQQHTANVYTHVSDAV